MPTAVDTLLVVLHQLRLKGVATTEAVAGGAGVGVEHAIGALRRLEADGLAVRHGGRMPGYALTASGRAAHGAMVGRELATAERRDAVQSWYRAFLVHNAALVAACTAWQVRDLCAGELNDHTDAAYDAVVLDRLERLHVAVVPVCDALTVLLPRFGVYVPRLTGSLEKVRSGLHEWFAQPLIDSYHTVWMELHEDLLVTLHIERSSETAR